MATSPFARKQDRQPYPPTQPEPTPAPAPAPPLFQSEHAARSFATLLQTHYVQVGGTAMQQDARVAHLKGRIDELQRAVARREQEIQERQQQNAADRDLITKLASEKDDTERFASNNWDDANTTARALVRDGFEVPQLPPLANDVLVSSVASVFAPAPTGAQNQPLLCGCGGEMQLDEERTQYIHPLSEGGWEVAGESCRRRREQTQVMAAVDDVVVGS